MSTFPAKRIHPDGLAQRPMAALFRLQTSIKLDSRIENLISMRASQLNGCAFCLDMHWKEARAHGETEDRLYSLDAWRESPLYEERERAALELCEAMTLITDGHVPDQVWERAAEAFDEEELAQLMFAITAINAWNRIAITSRAEPGHYEAGMLEAI